MAYNLFQTPKLTKPVAVYDPTKSVEDNMNGQGKPSAANINAAYQTPQAQLQMQSAGVNGNNESKSESQQPVLQQAIPAVDPNDPTSGMNTITSMYTSPEQEEKMRKASVANQRILAIGDALRHIGNIYHTTKYAPAQQFNSPVTEEQQRYEKGKAVRDAANLKFYTYQQAKAVQDAKQRQWEHEYNLKMADAARKAGYTEAQIKNMQDRLAQQKAYQDANLALGHRRADDAKALGDAKLKQQTAYQNKMAAIAQQNANNNKRRTEAYVNKVRGEGSGNSGVLDTPKGQIRPNGRNNYGDQLLQMFNYAETQGLVTESDVSKRLRELGLGKDKSNDIKRQMVMNLLRTNQSIGDYAVNRLGWKYNNGTESPSIGWDDDDDDNNGDLEIGW